MGTSRSRFATLLGLGAWMLASVGPGMSPAHALPPIDATPNPPVPRCLQDVQALSFTATPATVDLEANPKASTMLAWKVKIPSACAGLTFDVQGHAVSPQGQLTVQPIATTIYLLHATLAKQVSTIATTTVQAHLPPLVTINATNQTPLLVQALNTPHTTILVENQVELDLRGYESIPIQEGVVLQGGRTARQAGPRLYTTTRPSALFRIQGDHVRITGLRLQGPEMGIGREEDAASKGISSNAHRDIEIDHNELYGWSSSAVEILDDAGGNNFALRPETIHIHDNFIHHNQHDFRLGYGVVISHGAYALIERNVFDWNRHAIAGDGSFWSGYRAYENLVLPHGGHQRCVLGICWHTHQFDMHGQKTCGIGDWFSDTLFNCGIAGHDMDIRRNAFLYTNGPAIKLRGTPQQRYPYGMLVADNVFAHDHIEDAVEQTEDGLYLANNQDRVDSLSELGTCDFDGDGIDDAFLATGQTWWYASGGQGPWVYLNTSTKRRHDVTLGYFDTDRRCDVFADGLISSGGTTPWQPLRSARPPLAGTGLLHVAPVH